MYKVIIADDEKIIQEGLVESIAWEQLGFQIVGCFSDGRDVIEYLDTMPVDVIFTDIMMGHIGGIEVAKYVKTESLPCKVVFISGFSDFELARQAVKLGVTDYIMKPIQLDEVTTTIKKIKCELDNCAFDATFRSKQDEYRLRLQMILKDQFFDNLILGSLDDKKEISEKISFLLPGCDLERSACMLLDMTIGSVAQANDGWDGGSEQFFEKLYRFVDEFHEAGLIHILHKNKDRVRLFAVLKAVYADWEDAVAQCDECAYRLSNEMKMWVDAPVTVAVTHAFPNLLSVIELRDDLLAGNSEFYDKDILLQEQKKLIVTNILLGNYGLSQKVMKGIIKGLAMDDIRYCRNVVVDILSSLNDSLQESNPKMYRSIRPYIDYHIIVELQTADDIERYCTRLFGRMKNIAQSKEQLDSSALVNRAKKYVREHIFEDVLLDDIANEVFFSVSHLRRVFKKETGETFLQYVIRKKMEKAAEMLHYPQYKVYQISDMLGYKSTRYFSKLFYSNIGYYPAEYRKKVLHMTEVTDEE